MYNLIRQIALSPMLTFSTTGENIERMDNHPYIYSFPANILLTQIRHRPVGNQNRLITYSHCTVQYLFVTFKTHMTRCKPVP